MLLPALERLVPAVGDHPSFEVGEEVRVLDRNPIGHYRVPTYLRGAQATVVRIIRPAMIDNEQEGYGRNAGDRRHYYRIAVPLVRLWPQYVGSPSDELRIEVFETWLERL
ncbi:MULTISPECIES: SH3-like domain-containing protein [Kaistia]|jgi:hypothetical protein|uniref:Nitrile hydratase beta subunit domain-containing protein n=1 Tax=Kaistia defluvii TaxID=410841 RepID=A0ABV2R5T9_9HYPH